MADAGRLGGSAFRALLLPDLHARNHTAEIKQSILKLAFWSTGYVKRVKDVQLDLKILHRASDYLVARILYGESEATEPCAVISHIEPGGSKDTVPHCCLIIRRTSTSAEAAFCSI